MFELLSLPFVQRALVAIVLIAIITAFLGVFVILRRMAFFADAIAHASLAGIALGVLLSFNPTIAAVIVAVAIAFGIAAIKARTQHSLDTIIGIFYSVSLAFGIIILSFSNGYRVDLNSYLFGDVLSVDWQLIGIMAVVGVLVVASLAWRGPALIRMALEPQVAQVEGVKIRQNEYLFMFLLALAVAVGIKVAGIILIGPLLIIPAATAKNVASNFKAILGFSLLFSILSGILGLAISYAANLPSGPTIVATAGLFFFMTLVVRK